MIRVFYGDDRVRAKAEITKILGSDYEVLEGTNLTITDLPSIFSGASLFSDQRRILINDFTVNKALYDRLLDYIDTRHEVILFETKIDKRTSTYKTLEKKIEFKEFKLPEDTNAKIVFDIYNIAKTDGKKAVTILKNLELNQDPVKFVGLLTFQAIKDFNSRQGTKERRALKELSKLDILMKTTSFQPWLLIESFLLQVSTF